MLPCPRGKHSGTSLTRYRLLALESDAANRRRAGLKHLLKVNCKVKVNSHTARGSRTQWILRTAEVLKSGTASKCGSRPLRSVLGSGARKR